MAYLNSLSKAVNVYVLSVWTYGFTRAATWDRKDTQEYYNSITRRREVKDKLVVEKVGGAFAGGFIALFVWPFMLGEDLTRLECVVRGKNAREYGIGRGAWWNEDY